MPHKVLHVFGKMDRGGAELRTLELMRHMDRHQLKHHFLTLSSTPGSLDDEIRQLGAGIYRCPLGMGFGRRFRRVLRENSFDTVQSHVHHFSGYLLRLACHEHVSRRIAHFMSTGDGRGNSPWRRLQRRILKSWIDRFATSIVAVSEGAMVSAWDHCWRDDPRCRVIYDGLDVAPYRRDYDVDASDPELNPAGSHPLIIHVGSIQPPKNHLRLISIFAQLRKSMARAKLLMVGRDVNGHSDGIRNFAEKCGLSADVVFCGERQDVPLLLHKADLMIFPSLREGLPGAVLEACAAGTPVLASDIPGCREIARHMPLVRCLPLEATDVEWSAAAARWLGERAQFAPRQAWPERVAASPFGISACATSLFSVYGISYAAGAPMSEQAGGAD